MNLPSRYLEEAVEQLASLPGIGRKTALRLVLQLVNRSSKEIERFAHSFLELKANIRTCNICGNISDQETCTICENHQRDHQTICIVEDLRDILAIESTETYKGVYHVLGGLISPMDGIGPSDLNIPALVSRCEKGQIKEIIFALSSTMEGDTTNFYLYKKLGHFDLMISMLSRGVSIGTELQYADELTLGRSLQNRQPFKT